MKKALYLWLMVGLVAGFLLGGCAKPSLPPTPAAKPIATPTPSPSRVGWPKALSIGTSSATGSYYILGTAWADLIKKYVGVTATAEVTGGSGANMALIKSGEAELAIASGDTVWDGFLGVREFAGTKVSVRTIMKGHMAVVQLFTLASSGIKTPEDMHGKTYKYNLKGSPGNINYGKTLIECYKLEEPPAVKSLIMAGTEDSTKSVLEGTANVAQTAAIGSGTVREMALTKDIHFIPLSEKARDCMVEKYKGFVKTVIPKGLYKGVNNDVPAIGWNTYLVVKKELPADLVYQLIAAILDHEEEFSKYHGEAKQYTLKEATKEPFAAFHDGAIQYYKNKGVWGAKEEETQKRLLAELSK